MVLKLQLRKIFTPIRHDFTKTEIKFMFRIIFLFFFGILYLNEKFIRFFKLKYIFLKFIRNINLPLLVEA